MFFFVIDIQGQFLNDKLDIEKSEFVIPLFSSELFSILTFSTFAAILILEVFIFLF